MSKSIDDAVNKFLSWKLPDDFSPDGGVVFIPPTPPWDGNQHPTGTNLLTATQAKAMLEHIVGERIAEQDAEIAELERWQADARIRLDQAVKYGGDLLTENAQLREQVARMPVCVGYVSEKDLAIMKRPNTCALVEFFSEECEQVHYRVYTDPPSAANPQPDGLAQEGCQHLVVSQSNDLSETCLRCGKHFPPPIQEPPHA